MGFREDMEVLAEAILPQPSIRERGMSLVTPELIEKARVAMSEYCDASKARRALEAVLPGLLEEAAKALNQLEPSDDPALFELYRDGYNDAIKDAEFTIRALAPKDET